MKKKILLLILGLFLLCGCSKNESITDAKKFKEEYESFNGTSNDYFEYRNLSIDEENPFVYSTAEEIVTKIENKETFYVYFGDPECPWCRSVIENAIKIAKENNIDKIYYVRIWNGFHNEILRDTYSIDDKNVVVLKNNGTDSYYNLLDNLGDILSDYTLTDSNGKTVNVGEKRIFAPDYIYVKDGTAQKITTGISSKQNGYNGELTDEVLTDEESMFTELFQN